MRANYATFLDFSDGGRRINYDFITESVPGLEDLHRRPHVRLHTRWSRGAIVMDLTGRIVGLHERSPGTHAKRRAGKTVTVHEAAETANMQLGTIDELQAKWPLPVYDSGVSVLAVLADCGRQIHKT